MGEEEKKEILGRKLDSEELEQAAGGTHASARNECPNKGIVGGCSGAFYIEQCRATVENGSGCWRNDWTWADYTLTPEAKLKYKIDDHKHRCTWLFVGSTEVD